MWLARLTILLSALCPALTFAQKPTARVEDKVARFQDDLDCMRAVEAHQKKQPQYAWRLIVACITQDKFRNVSLLFKAPWRAYLMALPTLPRLRLVAHAMASEGRWTNETLQAARQAGIPIERLDRVVRRDRPEGYLLFQGELAERVVKNNGALALVINEIPQAEDFTGDGRSLGVTITAQIADPPIPIRAGNEYIFLGRLLRYDDSIPHLDILDVFKPGVAIQGL